MSITLSDLFLFFQLSDDDRDLHSFPTRRSSDPLGSQHVAPNRRQHLFRLVARCQIGGQRTRGDRLDRKSTRLNSSHANISYAVFCLKKKTRRPELSPPHHPVRKRPAAFPHKLTG